tara:strand:- start:372 stop:2597 length:2226 start_codon:yes stop_codon:yes gene_type:complete
MTPKEYKQMMDYLTRSSIKDKVKFASNITKPDPKPIVEEIELFNEFNKRNPMANGGLSPRGSKQVFTKKGKKTSEILKEKRVLGKDMLKYLEARFPKIKDYEKFYRNASKDDVANWKKAAPTYVEIQKIPNIEKAGKYPFGTKAVGGYVEKVKLIKQFNELKPTYKTMGKGTGAKGFSERPFTLDEWLNAGPERRKIGRMSKEEYLNYRNVAKGKIKEFKKKEKKRLTPQEYEKKYLIPGREQSIGKPKGRTLIKPGRSVLLSDNNVLLNFMSTAAKKQAKSKNKKFIDVLEKGKFVGVKDVDKGITYYHDQYKGKLSDTKKLITSHPDFNNTKNLKIFAKRFKYSMPSETIGSYFAEYKRVPTMGELANFLTRARINLNDSKELVDEKLKLVAKYSDQAMQTNPLHLHHTLNVEGAPTKGIMLSLQDRNDAAGKVVRNFNKGNIDKIEATKQLKKINTAALLGKEVVGAKTDVPLDRQLASATRRVNKMFFDALKQRPDVVEAIAKRFGIPGKVTAGALAGFLSFNAISPQEAVAGTGYETEIPTGLTTGEKLAGAGTAAAAFKFRKPIMRGVKAVGRGALKLAGPLTVPLELGFIGADLKSGSTVPEALADVVLAGGIFRERDKRKFIEDKYGTETLNRYVAAKTPGITDVMDMPTALPALSKELQAIDAEADAYLQTLRGQRAEEFKRKSTLPKPEIDAFQAAGGGIAKLAGVSSGPPPESGPNSQGLQGLMKRVKNL